MTQTYYERYWSDPSIAPPSNDPTTPLRQKLLAEALKPLPKGAKVLDAGCGTGDFSKFINGLGFNATGIDMSHGAIEYAAKRFPECTFLAGTVTDHLPALAGKFNAIWSSEVIEHVFDVYGFLTDLHQCLVPGGKLILTTPYHGVVKNILIDIFGYANHYRPFGGHIRFFDRRGLGDSLQHCGFTVRKWSGFGRPWPLYKSFWVVAESTHKPAPPPPADS